MDIIVSSTPAGDGKVKLDVTVPEKDVQAAFQAAHLAVDALKERPLSEKQLGADPAATEENAVATRATRSLVERGLRQAIQARSLRIAADPKAEIDVLAEPGEPYAFTVTVDVVPDFTIEPFDAIDVKLDEASAITDEDVDARLEEIRGRAADVKKDSDAPIGPNDLVELSFESTIDGKPYDGGSAQGYAYTMGSQHLPVAFEEGLIGLATGDEKTITFTVPKDFDNPEIAGKEASFDVRIGRVASVVLPEIDDDFARAFDYADLAAWRAKIREDLKKEREAESDGLREKASRMALADKLTQQPDEAMIARQAEKLFAAWRTEMTQQGVNPEEYMAFLGLSEKDIREEMGRQAEELLRENLALEALFRAEGLELTDDDVRETLSLMVADGAMPSNVTFDELDTMQLAAMREMTMHRMATDVLMEKAVFV